MLYLHVLNEVIKFTKLSKKAWAPQHICFFSVFTWPHWPPLRPTHSRVLPMETSYSNTHQVIVMVSAIGDMN